MKRIHVHADYDLEIIRKAITAKQKLGQDASNEIELYKAWLKFPDYAKADARNRQAGVYKTL
jgi:hypothetical protein